MATVFTQRAASHLRGAAPRFALQAHAGNLVAARQAPSFAMAQQRGGFRSASLQKSTPTCELASCYSVLSFELSIR